MSKKRKPSNRLYKPLRAAGSRRKRRTKPKPAPPQITQITPEMQTLLDESLHILNLSLRTINGLENTAGVADKEGRIIRVTTIRQLLNLTQDQLLARPGFGTKTLDEVRDCLAAKGFDTRRKLSLQANKTQKEFVSRITEPVDFRFTGNPEIKKQDEAMTPALREETAPGNRRPGAKSEPRKGRSC